jgi:pyruvate/2-oxoglutarate dehydrogenase complex dihydrolipoamide acyltransferase (E2) component
LKLENEKILNMYENMLTIRRFEEKAQELFAAGDIPGFVHLYIGEEAVATGACANLNEDDYITSTHRGHGHIVSKGGDLKLMMAELYGKKTGYCKGKGGSMHIADATKGILGANGIVGAGHNIAAGAGLSIKYRKTDAEKVAENLGVDINKIESSERIMKDDVVEYKNFQMLKEMANPIETREKMTNMRSVISERMSQSQQTSAAVHYNLSVDTREMKRLRDKLKPVYKVTYTDIIVKIVSRVLLEYPLLNCSVEEDEIIKRNYTNIGVAVALDEGLIVPVVKYANIKGLKTISDDIKKLADKARSNTLQPDEMTGGTFTVSNLGMFNIESFTPIINQPEVAILGINTIKETAVKLDGELQFIPMMTLSLTADHRVVDGSVAAQFLNRLKEYIENPNILIL